MRISDWSSDVCSSDLWVSAVALGCMVAVIPVTILWGDMVSPWIIPGLMAGLLVFGAAKRVPVYEAFVEGAKDGFDVAVRIVPYLVAILVAIAMRSEEHTSELQSLMRTSYAVFC